MTKEVMMRFRDSLNSPVLNKHFSKVDTHEMVESYITTYRKLYFTQYFEHISANTKQMRTKERNCKRLLKNPRISVSSEAFIIYNIF